LDEKIITPDGIKQARDAAKKPNTRLIKFLDGITRHISLPGWQWAVLDGFSRPESRIRPEHIIELAFDAAVSENDPETSFEEKLRCQLAVYLVEGYCYVYGHVPHRSNDS